MTQFAQKGESRKPHIRLRCKLMPWVPRLGWSFVIWRAEVNGGAYGAWFQNPAKALEAAANSWPSV